MNDDAINPARLALARETRKLSQAELARRVEVSRACVSQLERGVRGASLGLCKRLSKALGFPLEWLTSADADHAEPAPPIPDPPRPAARGIASG